MREPNFSFPGQNRAAICITSSIYDRRALDCTDYIPIINTLTNLAYLTGSTPTIRDYITRDGGLERLVTILKNTKVNDRKNGLKWTLAFQCVVNIGVRGTEHIRKRVVQAGMVPVIVNVLESFFAVLKSVSDENERRRLLRRAEAAQQQSQPLITDSDTNAPMLTQTQPFGGPMTEETSLLQQDGQDSSNSSSSSSHSSTSLSAPSLASTSTTATTGSIAPSTTNPPAPSAQHPIHYHQNIPGARPPAQDAILSNDARSVAQDVTTGETRPQQFFYREDDILHSLQLLAYLSKYPSLRSSFHTESGSNVFAIVEKFTHRTMHPLEIQYWAGVIMRNACRKDDTRKGIRQCAYTGCGKWETKPREFAKCRRCRKAKYCSKQCQSKAWNEGHRWWCIEKKPETMGVSTSFGTDLPPAPPPPPPPADLQDQADGNPNIIENGNIVSAGGINTRMIGGGDGGSNHGHHVNQLQQQQHHRASSHQLSPAATSSTTSSPYNQLMSSSVRNPGTSSQNQQQPQTLLSQPQQPHQPQLPQYGSAQQRLPQSQPQLQPQQQMRYPTIHPQTQQPQPQSQARMPQYTALQHPSQPFNQHQIQSFQHQPTQQYQQQPLQQQTPLRHLQASPEPLPAALLDRRPFNPQQRLPSQTGPNASHLRAPQRSVSTPHPSTAPLMSTPRTELTPHLGISPDSPTPEQLAQRFVQQVALHPGQHNELAQQLHAQFQQYFPPNNQAEAKRQFSFHAREYFARYQRQQELLRSAGAQGSSSGPNNVAGRPAPDRAPVMPTAMSSQGQQPLYRPTPLPTNELRTGREPEPHRQGTSRRRSDLDSDDDDTSLLESGSHSTVSMSVPMLTQDLSTLSTTMSLSSTEISEPLPASPVENRFSAGSSLRSSSSSIAANGSRSDLNKSDSSSSLRDYKVRKLMSPEQSGSSSSRHGANGSSSDLPNQEVLQHGDEWTYSRHMAKDASTAP
ncbi:hypothetical protein FBU30_007076 [Linnemannia zychae]|nr:hypothetical protein FBU30_007076 [Linnemannia zychae]